MLNYILEFIEKNQDSVIIVFVVAVIQLYIANRFQKKLETHKGDVNSRIEDAKHNQQKAYKEFDLYTTKRYEVYPELHKEVEYAYAEITGLRGVRASQDLRNYDKEEIEEYMRKEKFTNTDIATILVKYQHKKEEAIREIQYKMQELRYYNADHAYARAYNYFLINELYLSDEAAEVSRELLESLYNYWVCLSPEFMGNTEIVVETIELRRRIPDMRKDFKNVLKTDMRKSFSE